MTTTQITPARVGRERECVQCGTVYRSPRASRFCSNACNMKAKRGTKPTRQHSSDPAAFTPVGKLLLRCNLAGPIGRTSDGGRAYGLTVRRRDALAEAQHIFDTKGWGLLSEGEFDAALALDGFQPFSTDSELTLTRKRLAAARKAA